MAELSDVNAEPLEASLRGSNVEQLRFDHAFSLVCSGGTQLRIETTFSLEGRSIRSIFQPPITDGGDLLLSLFGQEVTSTLVTPAGDLHVCFDSDVALRVEVDPDYKAWSLVHRDGSQIIALPGGSVATFGPNSKE